MVIPRTIDDVLKYCRHNDPENVAVKCLLLATIELHHSLSIARDKGKYALLSSRWSVQADYRYTLLVVMGSGSRPPVSAADDNSVCIAALNAC